MIEITKDKIQTEVVDALSKLQDITASFSNEEINKIPFEGSWTAGELGEHMIMSNSGFAEMLNGPTDHTERAPDEKVEQIKGDFLDFNTKMKSPDSLVPPKKEYGKQDLLDSLEKIKTSLKVAISSLDLSQLCKSFELPGYGFLTRLEAICFVIFHTQRHIHQLKKIKESLVNV